MKVNTESLLTIKNYGAKFKVTASYIYKLVKAGKMDSVVIDGVQFIDVLKFPKLPTKQ